jgi:uncharacterized RDD family membrane protein YckC
MPGLRKKERTWKDEVRDRVRDRRQLRTEGRELPLFREPDDASAAPEADEVSPPEPAETAPPRFSDLGPPPAAEPEPRGLRMDEPAAEDLTLRVPDPIAPEAARADAPEPRRPAARDLVAESPADEWSLGPAPAGQAAPVERPAQWGERLQAGLVDLVLLAGMWSVVVYFAGRAAHVSLPGLRPAWPYLAGYLALLGLLYATYFTGATGQTLGKRLTGLKVVDADGRPPGWRKALARAAVGSVGILLAGSVLFPILVDPARRGFHDRLLKTRVVKH